MFSLASKYYGCLESHLDFTVAQNSGREAIARKRIYNDDNMLEYNE